MIAHVLTVNRKFIMAFLIDLETELTLLQLFANFNSLLPHVRLGTMLIIQ